MADHSGPRVHDALALGAELIDELVVTPIRDTHHAISDRVHGLLDEPTGGAARGIGQAHRAVSGAVYGSIGLAVKAADKGFSALGAAGVGPALEDSPAGRFLNAAVHGIRGDRIRDQRLAIRMAVRADHRDVPLTPEAVAAAFPDAGTHVAVFLHGMTESDASWRRRPTDHGRRVAGDRTYAASLAEQGWSPVFLRANTGLAVRENGVELHRLLTDLVAAWPVPVTRIALVGHSMGGLIIRAAAALRTDDDCTWTPLVTDVVTLGTPHLGAPLAGGVGRAATRLGKLPETAPLGRILDLRALGIDDLVEGLGEDVPALPHARYRLVSATLSTSSTHPVGHYLGDLLVRVPSAHGKGRLVTLFPDADLLHIGSAHHFDLLNDVTVDAALREWLA
ncbi:esterase/lipase family protein [Actinomycetota bacterium]